MNVKTFYETLANLYAFQSNVKVAKVHIAENKSKKEIKLKCKAS